MRNGGTARFGKVAFGLAATLLLCSCASTGSAELVANPSATTVVESDEPFELVYRRTLDTARKCMSGGWGTVSYIVDGDLSADSGTISLRMTSVIQNKTFSVVTIKQKGSGSVATIYVFGLKRNTKTWEKWVLGDTHCPIW